MSINKVWKARLQWWAPLVAFLLVAIVGGYVIEQLSRNSARAVSQASIISCERTNELREQVNEQARAMEKLITFTADRMAVGGTSSPEVIDEFRMAASQMEEIPLVQCEQVFPSFGLGN